MANIDDTTPTTLNPYLDSLIWGGRWVVDGDDPSGIPQIAYYFASGIDPPFNYHTSAWSQTQITAFELALQLYENVANVDFIRVFDESQADITERLTDSNHPYLAGFTGLHEPPDPTFYGEPLWGYFNVEEPSLSDPFQGSFGFMIFVHELGHAIGLAHPHDGGSEDQQVFPGVTPGNSADKGDFSLNQGIWTVMSYNDGWDRAPPAYPSYGYSGTPMALDIAALQTLYGANMTFHTGDDVYSLPTMNASGTSWSCIWDAGGTMDEISGANAPGACTINLNAAPLSGPNAGGFVSWVTGIRGGFTIANGVVIENATGGKGTDTLTGNDEKNILTGNAGNDSLVGGLDSDTLDGGIGTDRMTGGVGDDLYWVDTKTDVVIESTGGGTDTIRSLIGFTLGTEVEILQLEGSADIGGNGNALANTLVGNSGANILDGEVGADTLKGGLGNDTYIVDDEKDTADETGGGGADSVRSSANSYALNTDIENLTLTGKATIGLGNLLANIIIGTTAGNALGGDAGNDSLAGGTGNDTLDGGNDKDTLDGGAGADSMVGGGGDDLYRIDAIGDKIDSVADAGTDTVESLITFALGAAQERLTLIGSAAINGTGNEGSNVITGNAAANILSGGGKGEADTLIGGVGSDTYIVDASSDEVTEADKAGTDLVKSSQSFTLDAFVENLTLIASGDIDGTGNAFPNLIIGNVGANKLLGDAGNDTLTGGDGADRLGGGLGSDAMTGGNGDDIYEVDSTTDKVAESSAAGGRDKVESTITYILGNYLEDLDLTKAGLANGTGNALDNLIVGSGDANILDGKGGADTMKGGGGNDIYVVDNLTDNVDETGGGGSDTIQIATAFDLDAPTIKLLGAVENLTLTGKAAISGAGNALANAIIGNSAANTLSGLGDSDSLSGGGGNDSLLGGSGNDTLDGGAGTDAMVGDIGDDVYVVDNAKDLVQETASDAADRINASISIDLGLSTYDNIEEVALIGTGAINATGDENGNRLTGNTGANILDGKIGDDTLAGGKGSDTYKIDSSADVVIEVANGGIDTVLSTAATYTLADANVENLTLLVGAVEGIGNDGKNKLTGNDLANALNGGVGADTLVGGKGDDDYLVDDAKDMVTEAAGVGTGIDTVISTAAGYTLGVNVEKLVLGISAISGAGNTLNNTLTGNAGDNTLDGKTGKDRMAGDAGHDTYFVDNAGDVVDESGDPVGLDTVNSSISFSLVAGTAVLGAVENLTLTGAAAVGGTGNDLANKITGNAGANVLLGGGGDDALDGGGGNDTLDGGTGNDSFTGGAGNDHIDVGAGNDTVFYTGKLDGKDIIDNFDGDVAGGGQDVLDLDGLFDKLTLTGSREDHVDLVVNATGGVDVRVDADGKAGFELVVATLNLADPADSITVGQDVLVGS
jgi:Ca2+-binding RTX toxin-like protein